MAVLVAAVWTVPYNPQCPDSPWEGNPAIARVGDYCAYLPHFATYHRDLSLSFGLSDQERIGDDSIAGEYISGRVRLLAEFGIENAAFAAMSEDIILYRIAAAHGHTSSHGDVMARMGRARQQIAGLSTLLQLQALASTSDLAGFRSLIESPVAKGLIRVQGEDHLLALYDQAKEMDFSGASEGISIHAGLEKSVDPDRYWTEFFVDHSQRLLAIESLRASLDDAKTGQAIELDWQDLRENAWGGAVIELTEAAPDAINLSNVRAYMNGHHALERSLLEKLTAERGSAPSP